MTSVMTADLCDEFGDAVRVADAVFESYGKVPRFSGRIATLRVFEDNTDDDGLVVSAAALLHSAS